ncbi:MAG: 1-phosphofructokinase family hexose kinase [Acidobacteria bacterium]|nr:1-phosphofructokinase family hexose kinase [Acidobacteriota bacterium]
MIICVSANPAIDKRLRIDEVLVGEVNRANSAEAFAGGKAAHVAMAAKVLGEDVVWIGLLGGQTGGEVERQLIELGIKVVSVRTASTTRSNLEIIDNSGWITEILEPGGVVTAEELAEFRSTCQKVFEEAGTDPVVVLSGSLPPGMPADEFAELSAAARKTGAKVIVDASGEAFNAAVTAGPDLIKPNRTEAENAVGFAIRSDEDAVKAARTLLDRGAKAIVLSLGSAGLLYCDRRSQPFFARPPKVEVVSTVGCGDATVAGFAVGIQRGWDTAASIRIATACGAANCLAALPGQIARSDVEKLMREVRIDLAA